MSPGSTSDYNGNTPAENVPNTPLYYNEDTHSAIFKSTSVNMSPESTSDSNKGTPSDVNSGNTAESVPNMPLYYNQCAPSANFNSTTETTPNAIMDSPPRPNTSEGA